MRFAPIARFASRVVDFCYPPQCAACGEAMFDDDHDIASSRQPLCTTCGDALIDLESAAYCHRCGMPIVELDDPCPYCKGDGVPHFERIVRLGAHRDPLKHLIHQMKYHGRWPIAELLARRMVALKPVKALLTETDVLVPVPLHPWRQIRRGFNQADVIARHMCKLCGVKVAHPLARVKRTPPQIGMTSIQKRVENLRGAFLLEYDTLIEGKHVVIVDDVMTTGSTLRAAAQEIAKGKPASMSALVVAVADPKGRDFQLI